MTDDSGALAALVASLSALPARDRALSLREYVLSGARELVDIEALRALWLSSEARDHFRSCTQLQAAWLARHAGANGISAPERVEESSHGGGHGLPVAGAAEPPSR